MSTVSTMTYELAARRIMEAGLRMTRTRALLLRLILESTGPFSVKMLHERAEEARLNIHLATVHRNLAEFVSLSLVDELPGEDNRLYALHSKSESGAHLYCIDCRAMIPLEHLDKAELEALDALGRALVQKGFDASTMRMMLTAHCIGQQRLNSHNDDPSRPAACERQATA